VHYEGDETVYVPVTHGNSKKDNASEYTRTAPSVLKKIEDQVKSGEIIKKDVSFNVVFRKHRDFSGQFPCQIISIYNKIYTFF
jgi:hypothetical protein